MSLRAVVQGLRQLPYTEMKALSEVVNGKIPRNNPTDAAVADALSSLPDISNEELDNEQRYLASFFNRKRSITITTGNGIRGPWTVKCEGGVTITRSTLRGAISEFLDAQAAYIALRK